MRSGKEGKERNKKYTRKKTPGSRSSIMLASLPFGHLFSTLCGLLKISSRAQEKEQQSEKQKEKKINPRKVKRDGDERTESLSPRNLNSKRDKQNESNRPPTLISFSLRMQMGGCAPVRVCMQVGLCVCMRVRACVSLSATRRGWDSMHAWLQQRDVGRSCVSKENEKQQERSCVCLSSRVSLCSRLSKFLSPQQEGSAIASVNGRIAFQCQTRKRQRRVVDEKETEAGEGDTTRRERENERGKRESARNRERLR